MERRLAPGPKALILTLMLLSLILIIACGGATEPSAGDAAAAPGEGSAPPAVAAAPQTEPSGATVAPTAVTEIQSFPTLPPTRKAGEAPAPTVAPQPTAAPVVAAGIKLGGHIPMVQYAATDTKAVHQWAGPSSQTYSPLFNQILEFDPETAVNNDIRCDLCTSWELAENGTTYTFHLVDNARWWDGSPVTIEDVIFSLESIVDTEFTKGLQGGTRSSTVMIKPIYESSRAVDPHTLEVRTNFPSPTFIPKLAIDTLKVIKKFDPDTEPHMAQTIVHPENLHGSGPFKLEEFEEDVKNVFVKNDDYFKEGYPRIDGMTHFVILDPGTTIAAFLTEKVLMQNMRASNLTVTQQVQLAEDGKDILKAFFPGPGGQMGVMLNTRKAPFDDVRVRRAIMLAIHRQPLIETFNLGNATLGLPMPPGTWYGLSQEEAAQAPGFRELNGEKHPDDIAEAKRLLTEAGYPDGFTAEMTARTALGYPDVAVVVTAQLKKFLNIEATVKTMEPVAGFAAYEAGDYIWALQASSYAIPDPDAVFARWRDGGTPTRWADWLNTPQGPIVQDLYLKEASELNQEQRRVLIREAADILLNVDNAYIGLYWYMGGHIVNNKIQNYNPVASSHIALKHEHTWCDPAC